MIIHKFIMGKDSGETLHEFVLQRYPKVTIHKFYLNRSDEPEPCIWSDDFTGEDGAPIDEEKWDISEVYSPIFEIRDNKIYAQGTYFADRMTMIGVPIGDFEIEISYAFSISGNVQSSASFAVFAGGVSLRKDYNYDYGTSEAFYNSPNKIGEPASTNLAETWRIKRTGTLCEIFIDGVLFDSYDVGYIDEMPFFIEWDMYNDQHIEIDTFLFLSGCPEVYVPPEPIE